MIKIKWLAHASFLIEGEGLRIITDPYEPNHDMNLPPITEPADIVIRSSSDDEAHSFVDSLPKGFNLVTATEIVSQGTTVSGVSIDAIWSQESQHKEIVRDNAMYRFTLDGISIAHMGDVGNPLNEAQLDALSDTDILLALTGGHPTIDLDDLQQVIESIKPKIVIPMHYRIPGPTFFMLPIQAFTDRYDPAIVEFSESTEVTYSKESLPAKTHILVLQPSLASVQ